MASIVMASLGMCFLHISSAHAGWLPDAMVGSPEKASREHKEKQDKVVADSADKAKRKVRAEQQSIYLTRQFIARENRKRRTVIGAPDYSSSENARTHNHKPGKK